MFFSTIIIEYLLCCCTYYPTLISALLFRLWISLLPILKIQCKKQSLHPWVKELWSLSTVCLLFFLVFHIYFTIENLDIGLGNSSAVGPHLVGQLASAFLDALYQA